MINRLLFRYLKDFINHDTLTAIYTNFFGLPSSTDSNLDFLYNDRLRQAVANSRVIPLNIHQIWPHWVHAQYALSEPSYCATGFGNLVTNTTQRNWTNLTPIHSKLCAVIDPKGLVTVSKGGWSIDTWLKTADSLITPAKSKTTKQSCYKNTHLIQTQFQEADCSITMAHFPKSNEQDPNTSIIISKVSIKNISDAPITRSILIAIRPYNPEGISPIHSITYLTQNAFMINEKCGLILTKKPTNIVCSNFEGNDVSSHTHDWEMILDTKCPHNLASAYAEYQVNLAPNEEQEFDYSILLQQPNARPIKNKPAAIKHLLDKISTIQSLDFNTEFTQFNTRCAALLEDKTQISTPNSKLNKALEHSLFHLYSMTSKPPKAGAYTYSAFHHPGLIWNGLTLAQTGGFQEVHWIIQSFWTHLNTIKTSSNTLSNEKFYECVGSIALLLVTLIKYTKSQDPIMAYKKHLIGLLKQLKKRALKELISTPKRLSLSPFKQATPTDPTFWGLMWLISGLNSAKILGELIAFPNHHEFEQLETLASKRYDEELTLFSDYHGQKKHLPTSHSRLMDSDIIMTLMAVHPLRQLKHNDPRVLETLKIIDTYYTHNGRYFSYISETGYPISQNALLAQIYTLNQSPKAMELLHWLTDSISPTGAFPTAIHPITNGGSTGDGHDITANAHYYLAVLNQLILTTQKSIILFPSIPHEWLHDQSKLTLSNLHTPFGKLSVNMEVYQHKVLIKIESHFHTPPSEIKLSMPIQIASMQIGINTKPINSLIVSIPPATKSIELTLSERPVEPISKTQETTHQNESNIPTPSLENASINPS